MRTETLSLADGRTLSYVTCGPADGPVVVVHDGYGSRLLVRLAENAALAAGVRIVAPDRPGFWESSSPAGDPLVTWPADLGEMLKVLGIERCSVLGASAGCPFAFAAAVSLGAMVSRVAIAGPAAPIGDVSDLSDLDPAQRRSMLMAHRAPRMGSGPMHMMARVARRWPGRAVKLLIAARPPADAARMRQPEMVALLEELVPELFGDGRAAAAEFRALVGDWGELLEGVTQPTRIWAGTEDSVHPISMGRHLEANIENARLETLEGAFLAVADQLPAILEWAVAD